ncbi:MAG: AAA family ATPase, partial [Desulfobacterales bacterium]
MDYFSILNLNKEPFSNSPDPEYFYQSRQHFGCLQKLELSLRLRRGLNVIIGDVGTGKTTLCRQLIRGFATDDNVETHLILDPYFKSSSEFLATVAEMFKGDKASSDADDWQLKEIIKQYIFRRGVDENKTVVLIIDEGQKIPVFCLEILREFLNYETNEYKLLQIAIFAQREFEKVLEEYTNLADRINLYHLLEPLDFRDTRLMIRFRLKQSSMEAKTPILFSYPALWAIYNSTGGYPRKIINLCHRTILTMIIQNRSKVGWFMVRSCVKRDFSEPKKKLRWVPVTALVGLLVVTITAGIA